jgi:hypothetical protein
MLQNIERHKEISRIVSRDENTPELAQFWGKKYFEIIEKGLFILDSRFTNIIETDDISSFVPAGQILLCAHLDKENRLDEDLLIGTVETAVRLLDALVTFIWKQKNFAEINSQRILSLGLDDVDDFFNQYSPDATQEDREYIAQLVGETAYRASEFIAEEKGPFESYDEIKYDIKNNYFDTWIDENNNVKSNQEIQNVINEVQIGQYTLLPRRNMAMLNFATEKNWSKYSDSEMIVSFAKETAPNRGNQNLTKPFSIKMNAVVNNTEAKNKINNHVDEIFEHLLKERQVFEELPQPVLDQQPNLILEKVAQAEIPVKSTHFDESFAKEIRLYILIENNTKTVFAKHNNRLTLPFVSLDDNNNNLEKAIWEGVLKKYNLLINLDREFTVLYDPLKHINIINIGYLADLQNDTLPPDLFWAAPENEDFIDEVSYKLLTRYKAKVKSIEIKQIDTSFEAEKNNDPQPDKTQLVNTSVATSSIENTLRKAPTVSKVNLNRFSFKKTSKARLLYSLKLEQKIQTKLFGVVYIMFEYTKLFPQISDFKCDKITKNDKHALDVIVNLINLLLSNNYDLEKIEEYLEQKIKKDETNNINNFITVFIFAMREVPSDLSELVELLKS